MQIAIVNRAESENLHISKIQNGGRLPYWKSNKALYLRYRSTNRDEILYK